MTKVDRFYMDFGLQPRNRIPKRHVKAKLQQDGLPAAPFEIHAKFLMRAAVWANCTEIIQKRKGMSFPKSR